MNVLSGTQEPRLGRVGGEASRRWRWLVLMLGSGDGTRVGACGLRNRECPGSITSSSEAGVGLRRWAPGRAEPTSPVLPGLGL